MNGFTPGPWFVHTEPGNSYVFGNVPQVFICAGGEWPESQLARVNIMDELDEREANAALIAAAPESHEANVVARQAVQAFLDMVNVIQRHQALPIPAILETAQHNCPIILAQLDAAIAKARGNHP